MKTEKTITYFSAPGKENTQDCAEAAVSRAKELGISDIIVASCGGYTARIFYEAVRKAGLHLIVVTHAVGFSAPGVWEFDAALAEELKAGGVTIITGTHALSGMERAVSRRLGGASRTEAIAEAFRRTVAVGMKVAVECVLIAADQGAVPVDTEVIAVGGTEEGADTVVVVRPAHTASFFDLQIREFVAMPRNR
ncbi:MAG: pyruvate kinase alpha/beta domain-containing protein [Methanocorpusculum sp.]|nr:pyruvate kinase alpha/beta domain-containing protein [Methanocorpusculum sp.]